MRAVATGISGLLLLGIALASGSAARAAAASPSPCDRPQTLLRAGDYAAAAAAYAAVKPADASCVQQGKTAIGDIQQADALISVGQATEASDKVNQAFAADPGQMLPRSVLSASAVASAVTLAKKLSADGLHRQAVLILTVVTEYGSGVSLDPVALDILDPPGPSWWASLRRDARSYVGWRGLTAVAVVLIVALVCYSRTRRRLYLQPFTTLDKAAGIDPELFKIWVREELHRLGAGDARALGGHRLRLDVAGPYDEQHDIGAVAELGPNSLKLIMVLLGALFRRFPQLSRPRLVTCQVLPDLRVRVSMTTMENVDRGSETFKHKSFGFPPIAPDVDDPVAAKYEQLALPVARWVFLNWHRECTIGETRDPVSSTHFALGCAWEQEDLGRAEDCYRQAYQRDPRNTAAAVNLARLMQLRQAPSGSADPDGRSWRGLLQRAVYETRSKPDALTWYQSRYLLSVSLADNASPGDEPAGAGGATEGSGNGSQALHLAVGLALRVMEQRSSPRASVSREFLRNSTGPAVALAVSQMTRPSVETVAEVAEVGEVAADATDHDVIRELRKAQAGGDAVPERLVPFVERYAHDDPAVELNLARYERNRERACQAAATTIEKTLQQPSDSRAPAPDLQEQLQVVLAAARIAGEAARYYYERLSTSSDPVIKALVTRLAKARRPDTHRNDQGPVGVTPPGALPSGAPVDESVPAGKLVAPGDE